MVLIVIKTIVNIPFLGKWIKTVVARQLQAFLEETDSLDSFQSCFRPCYGTGTTLVTLQDDLLREENLTISVLQNLSAFFDTIDHGILLIRLTSLGLGGSLLQGFQSFLKDQSQMVQSGEVMPTPWDFRYGILRDLHFSNSF